MLQQVFKTQYLMRENDYINATDLGKILALDAQLKLLEGDVTNTIYPEELKEVRRIISHWKNRCFKLINKYKSEKFFFKNQCVK